VTYYDSGAVRVDLASGIATGQGPDRLLSIEGAQGSDFDDTLIGDRGSNELNGGNGADVVSGAGGRDHTIGGRGDDVLRGGPGHDLVDDSIGVAQGTYPDTGRDTLLGGRGGDVLDAVDEVAHNDHLLGGAGRDRCRSDAGDLSSGC
jgi:Ca2+-binding RTX toxin-like protein